MGFVLHSGLNQCLEMFQFWLQHCPVYPRHRAAMHLALHYDRGFCTIHALMTQPLALATAFLAVWPVSFGSHSSDACQALSAESRLRFSSRVIAQIMTDCGLAMNRVHTC